MQAWKVASRALVSSLRRSKLSEVNILIVISLFIVLWLGSVVTSIYPGEAQLTAQKDAANSRKLAQTAEPTPKLGPPAPVAAKPEEPTSSTSIASAPQPKSPNLKPIQPRNPPAGQSGSRPSSTAAASSYQPKQAIALADPTNYGERFTADAYGRPVYNQPIVVLHETVASARSTLNYFQTPHPKDNDQVSYHALILRDGMIVYLVPPEKRAFGAGNSVFMGPNGAETVRTKLDLPPSVNNFAYHISLETPPDGNNNSNRHSGYTEAQYQALSWLVARTKIPEARITTHQAVDRSGDRKDPRSFNFSKFLGSLRAYPRAGI